MKMCELTDAINRQKAKNPVYLKGLIYTCPECGRVVVYEKGYCPHCGQKLDWKGGAKHEV